VLASAVRNASTNSADITNYNGSNVLIILNITAVPGVDTITPKIQAKDPVSGSYVTLVTGTAQAANGAFFTSLPAALLGCLSRTWRVNITHSGAGNFTYSVGYTIPAR
jgi:hypothetical protein